MSTINPPAFCVQALPRPARLSRVNFPPASACIYCDTTRYSDRVERRTDEHVVPYALGGTLVIPAASCESCQRDTSRFEREIARDSYRAMRTLHGYPTRRPDEVPRTLPVNFTYSSGTIERVQVPIEEVPIRVVVPRFELAPFAPAAPGFPAPLAIGMSAITIEDDNTFRRKWDSLKERHRKHASGYELATAPFGPFAFARLVYKIGVGLLAIERPDLLSRTLVRARIAAAARFQLHDLFSAPAPSLDDGFFRARLFTAPDGNAAALFAGVRLFGALDATEHFCRLMRWDERSDLNVHFDATGRVTT
ncbi:MAG: HNH endonuclease [Kofleriaceae bacterium]|nr:MAG: HNH endonuclease [Kofleriaceae bacterium]